MAKPHLPTHWPHRRWMHPQDYEADEQKAKSVAAAEAAAALVSGDVVGASWAAAQVPLVV